MRHQVRIGVGVGVGGALDVHAVVAEGRGVVPRQVVEPVVVPPVERHARAGGADWIALGKRRLLPAVEDQRAVRQGDLGPGRRSVVGRQVVGTVERHPCRQRRGVEDAG